MDASIIIGTILVIVGVTQLTKYIIRKNTLPLLHWWHLEKGKQLTSYQEGCKNLSIQFLERVVNHRKTSIAQLYNSGLIDWNEYARLYDALMLWKQDKLESIHEACLSL